MRNPRPSHTLATRLVVWMTALGLFAAAGLAVLEYQRVRDTRQEALRAQVESARQVVGDLLDSEAQWDGPELVALMRLLKETGNFRAVRLWDATSESLSKPVVAGSWLRADEPEPAIWTVDRHSAAAWPSYHDAPTVVYRLPINASGRTFSLELLVNSADRHHAVVSKTFWNMVPALVMLAVAALTALFLFKRWVSVPLCRLAQNLDAQCGVETIEALAAATSGSPARAVSAVADTVRRVRDDERRMEAVLRENEALFDFAPTALMVLDARGRVSRANTRAVAMMEQTVGRSLLGEPVYSWVDPDERKVLAEVTDRLLHDERVVVPLRVTGPKGTLDLVIDAQCQPTAENEGGGPTGACDHIRLALQDQSRTLDLHQRLERHRRLLALGLDRAPGAVVLTDVQGRVVFHNRTLGTLLQRRPDELLHAPIDKPGFWSTLVAEASASWCARFSAVLADADGAERHWVEPVEGGAVRVSAEPLIDADDGRVGVLWRIEPVNAAGDAAAGTGSDEAKPIVAAPFSPANRVAAELHEARSVSSLLEATVESLRRVSGAEVAGIAIRAEMPGLAYRSRQLVSRGALPLTIEGYPALLREIESEVMPEVLHAGVTLCGSHEGVANAARAFEPCGLGAFAAAPLLGTGEELGVVWIARRPGVELDRRTVELLEYVARLVAPRLETAAVHERLAALSLMDAQTWLPTTNLLVRETRRSLESGEPLAILVLRADHFDPSAPTAVLPSGTLALAWADRLRARCRRNIFIAAPGPATFAVCVRGLEPGSALGLADRLRKTLRETHPGTGEADFGPWSAGVASYDPTRTSNAAPDAQTLLEEAWAHLLRVRDLGGDRVGSAGTQRLRAAS